jgi:hypothetical protein
MKWPISPWILVAVTGSIIIVIAMTVGGRGRVTSKTSSLGLDEMTTYQTCEMARDLKLIFEKKTCVRTQCVYVYYDFNGKTLQSIADFGSPETGLTEKADYVKNCRPTSAAYFHQHVKDANADAMKFKLLW